MTTIAPPLRLLQLELTAACQLTCRHCFASSSPYASHASISLRD